MQGKTSERVPATRVASSRKEGDAIFQVPKGRGKKETFQQQYFLVHSAEWAEGCRSSLWPLLSLCLSQSCPSFNSHMNLNTPQALIEHLVCATSWLGSEESMCWVVRKGNSLKRPGLEVETAPL